MGNKHSISELSQENLDLLKTQTGWSEEEIKEQYEEFMTLSHNGKVAKDVLLEKFQVCHLPISVILYLL